MLTTSIVYAIVFTGSMAIMVAILLTFVWFVAGVNSVFRGAGGRD